jgi:hypothetical protein
MMTAAALGTSGCSTTSKFCGRPVNFMISLTTDLPLAFTPIAILEVWMLTGEPS